MWILSDLIGLPNLESTLHFSIDLLKLLKLFIVNRRWWLFLPARVSLIKLVTSLLNSTVSVLILPGVGVGRQIV